MDNSKNAFLFRLSVFIFVALIGVVLFFLSSSPTSDFIIATIGLIAAVGAGGIGWYVRKKFPRGSSEPLRFLVFTMALMTVVVGHAGYRLAIERSTSNFVTFILLFGILINSFLLYKKEKKTASTLPNNKKEV